MAHKPKLFVRDSSLDARFLIVTDISQYDDKLPLENHTLFIQLPGFDDAVKVPFTVRGTVSYSSRSFICDSEDLTDLPDGLYTLTYSVAPNTKVFTAVYHFRTAILEKRVYGIAAQLRNCPDPHEVDDCGNVILQKKETILLRAMLLLEALKAGLCLHSDYKTAQDNYNEIQKMIASLSTRC